MSVVYVTLKPSKKFTYIVTYYSQNKLKLSLYNYAYTSIQYLLFPFDDTISQYVVTVAFRNVVVLLIVQEQSKRLGVTL